MHIHDEFMAMQKLVTWQLQYLVPVYLSQAMQAVWTLIGMEGRVN